MEKVPLDRSTDWYWRKFRLSTRARFVRAHASEFLLTTGAHILHSQPEGNAIVSTTRQLRL